MKKLILLTLLVCSLSMSAQQFTRQYNWGLTTRDAVKGEWYPTDVLAYFNYNNDTTKMKFNINGEGFNMTQNGVTTRETTKSGYVYQKLDMTDDETGESVIIELYDNVEYGVRMVFGTHANSIQFAP